MLYTHRVMRTEESNYHLHKDSSLWAHTKWPKYEAILLRFEMRLAFLPVV